ncbi:MAG: hypothetical protein R2830_00275 [Saprospiraceae bacterium]
MQLTNFITIDPAKIAGGAAIQATEADAFRQNGLLFHNIMQSLLTCPFLPNGVDGDVTDPVAHRFVQANILTVANVDVTATPKVPIVWFAREKIIIRRTVSATGMGAANGETGDFGGSGGGSSAAAGNACLLPLSNAAMDGLDGGASGAAGNPLTREWAMRALSYLSLCKGGASGGGASGGAGGGVIILCAPEIELAGPGKLEANGANAPGGSDAGGGGGGLIVLIAQRTTGLNNGVNVVANGGLKDGGGGNGGNGLVLPLEIK